MIWLVVQKIVIDAAVDIIDVVVGIGSRLQTLSIDRESLLV
ncbi:hypothetical protein [Halobacillus naozhouensis]|uniref:Uncharacterized protein n=1 Tax=Halobacillus naozhouensis TaxID=554880 RepID=A0ABY8J0V4_9BACI|nr:hypothetical protein [Halobacillus naozhouensis]WFT75682.1 hypothetical protein P9989_04645 [Halobacillus naozhouensis]